jgi:CO/xanthine dehydrogenase FAD-binding subunit
VRNLATVGGNVCNASPAGDILPPLLAFGASCAIVSPGGKRWVPLDRFFTGPGSTVLQPGELLTEFSLPPPLRNTGSLYIKHSPRGAMDIANVGVAAAVALEDDGKVFRDVKLALGAVAPTPLRVYAAEGMLRGQTIGRDLVEAAAREAQRQATPIDDVRSSAAYRRAMVGVLSRQALERAIEMAQGVPMSFDLQRSLATGAVA